MVHVWDNVWSSNERHRNSCNCSGSTVFGYHGDATDKTSLSSTHVQVLHRVLRQLPFVDWALKLIWYAALLSHSFQSTNMWQKQINYYLYCFCQSFIETVKNLNGTSSSYLTFTTTILADWDVCRCRQMFFVMANDYITICDEQRKLVLCETCEI